MRNRGSGTSRRSCPLVGPNVITPLTGVTDSATSTRRPGMSLTGLHHDCKAAAEDFVESVSGTNGIAGAADTIILISRPRNETQGLLKVTGRDVVEGEYAVTIQDGVWELMGESLESAAQAAVTLRATADLGNRSAEILRLVNKHPEGVRAGQVAEALADIDAKEPAHTSADCSTPERYARPTGASTPLLKVWKVLETRAQAGPDSTLPTPLLAAQSADSHCTTRSSPPAKPSTPTANRRSTHELDQDHQPITRRRNDPD
jgi:hypothetical protein